MGKITYVVYWTYESEARKQHFSVFDDAISYCEALYNKKGVSCVTMISNSDTDKQKSEKNVINMELKMKSDWDYVDVTKDIVFIKDLNLGRISVTDDAENVYGKLKEMYPNHRIVYLDSDETWTELVIIRDCIHFQHYLGDIPNGRFL